MKQKNIKRYYAVFHGNVQGIGFRFFAQREAEQCNLKGWVRNRPDGSVDIEVDGEESEVMRFIENLKTKHPWAHVSQVMCEERSLIKPYTEFRITF